MNIMEIIVPIGISGSGKSRLYRMRYSDYSLISPEIIRKELTGDINNHDKDDEVLMVVRRRIGDIMDEGKSIFYDDTNIDTRDRQAFSNSFIGIPDVKIIYVVLPADVELSLKRIDEDTKNNIEHSKAPDYVLDVQLYKYTYSLKNNFEGENVQEIIYVKPGDLD